MRARAAGSDVQLRDTRYWELMRSGLSNTEASRILGMHRKTGTRIRAVHYQQTAPPSLAGAPMGRYLSPRERLQIADLQRLGCSMRAIAAELGRSPSTIKRDWTGTATRRAGTCHTAPITPPRCSGAGPSCTS